MRLPLRILLALLLVGAVVTTGAPGAGAEGVDLPPGFTDGEPVGTAEAPPPGGEAPTTSSGPRATSTERYFGEDPWHAIEDAAAATSRPCALTDAGLTALVVSPVFKESSAATSPSTAPSPMTLSRYDEWSGTYSTATNRDANYGLYAFRDPTTSYKRAYWHPGVGIWQYDSSGVGAPYTAIERMDVGTVSADVAAGMAARYCNPSSTLIGHGPPYTGEERRNSAWAPWGYPCTLCEREFQAMTGDGPAFSNITLVGGISETGGAKARTCTLQGVSGTLPCWYVDASVGTIEGATAWATLDPSGGSPTVAPTPLAEAFYVLERNGREERHWLRADTGYDTDISGSREIGKNDRPRSNQTGSGVTWAASSSLCDLTAARGNCVPTPPAGVSSTLVTVNGTYRPVALDANGDDRGDVLWYSPGSASDPLWLGQGSGAFTSVTQVINSSYDRVQAGDLDGDGDDEVLWYDTGSGGAYLWWADGDGTFTSQRLSRPRGLRPLLVDRDADGRDEVFWYGPGSLADTWWDWNGSAFATSSRPVSGSYLPFVGDFDGNGRTDIFWYAPGSAADALWLHSGGGSIVTAPVSVSGLYLPQVGDYDGDGNDDIVWYAPGSAGDSQWFGGPRAAFATRSLTVSGSYEPIVADLEGDGRDDLVWYAPGGGRDPWWRWSGGRALTGAAVEAQGSHDALVGGFSAGGADGIVWHAPGPTPDVVWWR